MKIYEGIQQQKPKKEKSYIVLTH